MTNELDDIAHVRLPLISLVLLVALPTALIPVLQFLSISAAGNGASAAGGAANSLSLAAQPGSVIAGSIFGLLVAYVIGGRKAMFLAVLAIVVAVAAMLTIGSPSTFQWGRTALNLGAGALLVLPILVLGHYGSHRQIAAGMPGLILGPFILVALVGLLTRPETEDRIAALTNLGGLDAIEPMGWLATIFTILLVLALFRAMGRVRGGRPNALFSAALRADARDALGFVLTGPQIYALLIAMAFIGHAATTYLGDFARKSPLEGLGIGSTIAATLCLGFGGFIFARIFGPRRRQNVLATTIIFLFITTALMAATDFMFAPTNGSLGVFVWPYTKEQLVLLVLTCAAMAMLGASFSMIWLSIVEVGLGVLATILLITVLVARIAAPAAVPLLPISEMWLATGLLGAALLLVGLGTVFGRRARNVAPPAQPEEFANFETAEHTERQEYGARDKAEFDPEPEFEAAPKIDDEPAFDTHSINVTAEPDTSRVQHAPVAPPEPTYEPAIPEPPAESPPTPREPAGPDKPEEPSASGRPKGGLPWRRKRTKRDALERAVSSTWTEATDRTEPSASKRPAPPRRGGAETEPPATSGPARQRPDTRHEAIQETGIDWAKLGGTVVEDDTAPENKPAPTDGPRKKAGPETTNARRREPDARPPAEDTARTEDDAPADRPAKPPAKPPAQPVARREPAARPQPTEPAFTRYDSTIFDFDRLRNNTHRPDEPTDQNDEEKE